MVNSGDKREERVFVKDMFSMFLINKLMIIIVKMEKVNGKIFLNVCEMVFGIFLGI